MKKILILCSVFLMVSAGAASALTYDFWDIKTFGWFGTKFEENSNPYSFTHDITDNLDFSSEYVTSAYLLLGLVDDFPFFDDSGFFDPEEHVLVDIEGSLQDIGEVNIGLYKFVVDPTALSDGYLNVSLSVFDQWEDYELGDAKLMISKLYGHTAPVPEPGTMLLLGMGLLGFGVVSRKKLFKK